LIVEIFKELLHRPAPSAQEVARNVSEKLRRTEEARIYAWHAETESYPPPRSETCRLSSWTRNYRRLLASPTTHPNCVRQRKRRWECRGRIPIALGVAGGPLVFSFLTRLVTPFILGAFSYSTF